MMNERPVRFLLNGELTELTGVSPTLTVLNLLRYRLRLTGTKEGCAEGDCGACTVVLARLQAGEVRVTPVTSCILFAPMLDGTALLTVEGLGRGGVLDPVQQAMVDHHGSQCGFCTPGIVMSLYAYQHQGGPRTGPALREALAGNLCRCTGYQPILEAAAAMPAAAAPPSALGEGLAESLAALQANPPLDLEFEGRRFLAPTTDEAVAAAVEAHPDAVVVAGGTDVGLWITKQWRQPQMLISVLKAPALSAVKVSADGVHIGAAVRYVDAQKALAALHPGFDALLRRLGGPQVRALGTVCGNIANGSPIGDMPPALIAAGAWVILRKGAARRRLLLEAFFLDYGRQDRTPGEFVEAIFVPTLDKDCVFRTYKVTKRFDQDISAVCAGVAVIVRAGRVTQARIAFGGMAATPRRAPACEAALLDQPWTLATVCAASEALDQDYQPISDLRASAGYRADVAKALLIRSFNDAEGQGATPVLNATPVAYG